MDSTNQRIITPPAIRRSYTTRILTNIAFGIILLGLLPGLVFNWRITAAAFVIACLLAVPIQVANICANERVANLVFGGITASFFYSKIISFFLDIDGTLTKKDKVPKYLAMSLKLAYQCGITIVFVTGRDMAYALRILEACGFLAAIDKPNRVFIGSEHGLFYMDFFERKEEFHEAIENNPLKQESVRQTISALFLDYSKLRPWDGISPLQTGEELVKDAEQKFIVLSPEDVASGKIGYIALTKRAMMTAEMWRGPDGKILPRCLVKQKEAAQECQKALEAIGAKGQVNVSLCGTSIDFFPYYQGRGYSKSNFVGFMVAKLAKERNLPIKRVCKYSLAFGDGLADFDMTKPFYEGKVIGRVNMVYVGGEQNLGNNNPVNIHRIQPLVIRDRIAPITTETILRKVSADHLDLYWNAKSADYSALVIAEIVDAKRNLKSYATINSIITSPTSEETIAA
ncbi:MAG: HAD hydrolase family protein [Candidatus Paceibacterota bacterium]